ncbi:MAG TPA: aminotransferase class V-fold PLP-dependent enzyme [Candidatus Acidoferrum sp.]|nr:aminotransferase class V-fold PLP-dependent enzyme [Candidatus Acidoferrum sp.]
MTNGPVTTNAHAVGKSVADPFLRYRAEFPILDRTTYLISNSLGAMPRGVRDSLAEYAETWATRGVRAWEEKWWMLALEIGNQIGALMNAPANSVAIHGNVTQCQAVIASCFDFSGRRNKVVYSDLNFPSVMYFWQGQSRPSGEHIESPDARVQSSAVRVHMIKTDGVEVPTERLLDAIDDETLLVPISHVIFRSSYINDAKAICEKAHRVGAHVVLDAFQSLGSGVPVDVQALNVDFACGGVLKWLCAGPGVAYLYVRPDLAAKLQPKFTGWLAHENPFAFEVGPMRYAQGAYRFLNGTPAIPALYGAAPALKILRELDMGAVREKSKRFTARIVSLADQRGWRVNAPRDPERRGGTVAVDMPHSKEVCAELLKRDILVDWRPGAGVRISPHFYNIDAEIDVAFAAIDEIVRDLTR